MGKEHPQVAGGQAPCGQKQSDHGAGELTFHIRSLLGEKPETQPTESARQPFGVWRLDMSSPSHMVAVSMCGKDLESANVGDAGGGIRSVPAPRPGAASCGEQRTFQSARESRSVPFLRLQNQEDKAGAASLEVLYKSQSPVVSKIVAHVSHLCPNPLGLGKWRPEQNKGD